MEKNVKEEDLLMFSSKNHTNSKKIQKKSLTPHIDLIGENDINIRNLGKQETNFKNFNVFLKNIIDSNNENFLNGNTNIIEFIISKETGCDISEIQKIEKISLRINKDYGLLNQFGQHLPRLNYLSLNNSFIDSINDIGSSFSKLKILSLVNCRLNDLTGIICFPSLEVIDLSNNLIEDLFELEMCSTIIKLNLKHNNVKSLENIDFLSSISTLKWLNLTENPIQQASNYKEYVNQKLTLETMDEDFSCQEDTQIDDEISVKKSTSTFASSNSNFYPSANNKFKLQKIEKYEINADIDFAKTTDKFFKNKIEITDSPNKVKKNSLKINEIEKKITKLPIEEKEIEKIKDRQECGEMVLKKVKFSKKKVMNDLEKHKELSPIKIDNMKNQNDFNFSFLNNVGKKLENAINKENEQFGNSKGFNNIEKKNLNQVLTKRSSSIKIPKKITNAPANVNK